MSARRPLVAALAVSLSASLLALAAGPSSADRAGAEFYTQRADKALRDKDLPKAEEQYRKAIEEDASYAPAHGGLGETLLAGGDRAAGLAALRKAIAVADATRPLPPAWNECVDRFKRKLAELDTAGSALDKISDRFVTELLAYGEKWAAKDPEAAASALRDALRLRPDDARAKKLQAKVDKAEAAAWTQLFNKKDKTGWEYMDISSWYVSQGAIVGDLESRTMVAKTKDSFKGDFDVRMEAKLVKRYSDLASFSLLAAFKGEYRHSAMGVFNTDVMWREQTGPTQFENLFMATGADLKPKVNVEDWNVYEMRFRGASMLAVVNGNVLGTYPRPAIRDGGSIGLKVQQAVVNIRSVEIRAR